jgi:mannose-6-phosphate isomerase-like protein (cupin superfamily)
LSKFIVSPEQIIGLGIVAFYAQGDPWPGHVTAQLFEDAMKTSYDAVQPSTTRDGSLIRELIHPAHHGNRNQSLAEATVPAGATTRLHRHHNSEEIYHITAGTGRMTLGEQRFEVQRGDSICIAPGTPHCIANTGTEPLRILCCCSPPYAHDDTQLLDDA